MMIQGDPKSSTINYWMNSSNGRVVGIHPNITMLSFSYVQYVERNVSYLYIKDIQNMSSLAGRFLP